VAQEEARETKRLVAKFEKGGAAALRDMRESLIVAQARGMLLPVDYEVNRYSADVEPMVNNYMTR
jgi:hypothetical protein